MQIQRFIDSAEFLGRAESLLMRAEAENNVMLGVCGSPGTPSRTLDESCYLAAVEDGGVVVACAVRTPPYKAMITRASRQALACLVDDLFEKYGALPAVVGPEPDVNHFAELWAQRTGACARPGMRQRLLETREVHPPSTRPTGALRLATEADLSTIVPWAQTFFEEARLTDPSDPERLTRERVQRRNLFVWDAGRPVSMAGWAGRTRRGVRINFVYTPRADRNRGFASACVATLTQRLLDEGHVFCCLYTDLANPTSNKIYQAIGYHPVGTMSDVHFETAT